MNCKIGMVIMYVESVRKVKVGDEEGCSRMGYDGVGRGTL